MAMSMLAAPKVETQWTMVKGCRWFKLLVRARGGGMVDNMVIDRVICYGDVTGKM
jgi:hypothetical protein